MEYHLMFSGSFSLSYDLKFSKHPTNPRKLLVQPQVTAKHNEHSAPIPPQHMVFVIDRSGSMQGEKLENVKKGTIKLIEETLRDGDTFSVVSFDNIGEVVVQDIIKGAPNYKDSFAKINALKSGGGTQIENGLAVIGDKIKLADPQNCRIILLTDGQNNDPIEASQQVTLLKQRLNTELTPTIIPVGIGADYQDDLLKAFGDITGIRSTVHVKDSSDVDECFKDVGLMLRARTENIMVELKVGNKKFNCPIGTISPEFPGAKTIEIDIPDQAFSIDSRLTIGSAQSMVSHETPISTNAITLNRDIIANFASDRLAEINQNPKLKYEVKAVALQREVLPLLTPAYENDSEIVKKIRDAIIAAIEANTHADLNEVRAITSNVTMTTTQGSSRTRPQQGQTLTSVNGGAPNFDVPNKLIKGNNDIEYQIIDSSLDLAHEKLPRYLAVLQPSLSRTETVLIDTESPLLKSEARKLAKEVHDAEMQPLEKKLGLVANFVHAALPGTDVKTAVSEKVRDVYFSINGHSVSGYSLDEYITAKQALARQEAPFTGLMIAKLVKEKLLPPGKVRQFYATATNGKLTHMWTIYRTNDNVYLIDPSSPEQQVYKLNSKMDRARARYDYAKRGLEGILDNTFKMYNLLPAEDVTPIADELLAEVSEDDEKAFVDAGLIDPIYHTVLRHPVRIEGEPRNHVFEHDNIVKWFETNATNPIRGTPCSKKLLPALDVREQVIDLIAVIKRQKKSKPVQTNQVALPAQQGTNQPMEIPEPNHPEGQPLLHAQQQQGVKRPRQTVSATKARAEAEKMKNWMGTAGSDGLPKSPNSVKPTVKNNKNWDTVKDLLAAIKQMKQYGQQLEMNGVKKGKIAVDLAKALKVKAKSLYTMPISDDIVRFKNEFKVLLHSKDKEMSEYRLAWKTILKNIAIALTGVGLIAIVGKLIHSKVTEDRARLFFSRPKTTCEEKVENIDQCVRKVNI